MPTVSTTLTSHITTGYTVTSGDQVTLDYSSLDFVPSTSDPYKSTSGDVFKVYVGGKRIYRASDSDYASGNGFLEDGDVATSSAATTLNGRSALVDGTNISVSGWGNTNDNVWTINTGSQSIILDIGNVQATALYGSNGEGITFNASNSVIELRRSVQDRSTPSIDFSNASILTEQDLDNSSKNTFHMAQQAVTDVESALLFDTGTDTYNSYEPGTTNNKKISNVATPTAANDAANKTYVDGSSNTVTVAGNIANVNTVAGISGNVTTVAGIASNVTAVAGDATDIGAVAAKATEIGRLGTADAVADMAILGTSDVVADLNTLGTSDIVTDMNLLATSANVAAMALLGTSDAVADMNTLGTSDIVNDMNILGTSANVTAMNNLGTSGNVTNMATLTTGDNLTNVETCADNIGSLNTVATNAESNAIVMGIALG